MPKYNYLCKKNSKTIQVTHDINTKLKTWGEVCFVAQIPLGDTDVSAPVSLVITPPSIKIPISNSELKNAGFTKLVKRDDGVYENVTATDEEKRYMKAGDKSSLPHLNKKISN